MTEFVETLEPRFASDGLKVIGSLQHARRWSVEGSRSQNFK